MSRQHWTLVFSLLASSHITTTHAEQALRPCVNRGWRGGPEHAGLPRLRPAARACVSHPLRGKGGYSGTRLTLALSKRYPKWWAGTFLRMDDLHSTTFEDSPLLRNKTSYLAGTGLSWVFARSDKWMMSDD